MSSQEGSNAWVQATVNKLTCQDYYAFYRKCLGESAGKPKKLRECN